MADLEAQCRILAATWRTRAERYFYCGDVARSGSYFRAARDLEALLPALPRGEDTADVWERLAIAAAESEGRDGDGE